MSRILRACAAPIRWLRERYSRIDVPDGWTLEALAAIRSRWHEPLTGELPPVEDTAVEDTAAADELYEVRADELGLWVPALAEPVEPLIYRTLRDLLPTNLDWQPSWAVTL